MPIGFKATSLINHNPNFYDLLECIDTSGREHELFARAVKSRIENSGSLFVDKKEFNFNNIDNLRFHFNSKLWPGNEKNPKGHTGRRIEEFQSHFYIKEYVEKSIEIIDGLDKLTQSGIQNYSNSVKEWIKKNSTLIDDKEKENIVINLFEKSKVALIYGAAGTGKTTLIDYVSQFFKENSKIFLANTNTAIDNLKRRIFADSNSEFKTVAKLIASKNTKCDILIIDENDKMSFDSLDFSEIDINRIKDYVDFIEQSGLLEFLEKKANRSLVDYVYGVEAGLDSNARKNRSGTTMEGIIERHVSKIAQEQNLEWKAQATAQFIKEKWGVTVPVDKSERRFDVAVYSKEKHKVWLIETNYYGGGGSKLKAVAGEFTELSQFVVTSDDDVEFVWVTDGQGWKTAHLPLAEAFSHIRNIFNLEMLREGFLSELLLG